MADALAQVVPIRPLLRSALSLAERGWHVFPCVPGGKRPALRGGWHDHATTEPTRIRVWWSRAAYNIGIACGPSGLVVIDLDVPHDTEELSSAEGESTVSGTDVLSDLCDRHGRPYPLPTYAVSTPSGGCHLYYAAPGSRVRNSVGRLGLHIDVRANGGYAIGDGSRIGERTYTAWDQRRPVPLPEWLVALLVDSQRLAHEGHRHRSRMEQAYAMSATCTRRPGWSPLPGREPGMTRSTARHSVSASSSPPGFSHRWRSSPRSPAPRSAQVFRPRRPGERSARV